MPASVCVCEYTVCVCTCMHVCVCVCLCDYVRACWCVRVCLPVGMCVSACGHMSLFVTSGETAVGLATHPPRRVFCV